MMHMVPNASRHPRKVWLLLEEKQVDYETEKVPMRSYGNSKICPTMKAQAK